MASREKNWLDKTLGAISKMIIIITSLLMLILTLVVFFNVVARYFLNFPVAFTYEMVELLFPWIVFLTIISVTLDNENIDIQFFVKSLPKSFRFIFACITKIIMLLFSILVSYAGFNLADAVQNHITPVMGLSKAWLYWSVGYSFIGVSIIIIYQLILLFTNIKSFDKRSGL